MCGRVEFKGDVACQVVGRVLTERDAGWDVVLMTPNEDRDVAVRLRRDGTVEVGNWVWGRQPPVTMVGPIRHRAIYSGDKENKLLVVLRGGRTLEVYVNDEAVTRPIQLPQRLPVVCLGVGLWERCGAPELKGARRVQPVHGVEVVAVGGGLLDWVGMSFGLRLEKYLSAAVSPYPTADALRRGFYRMGCEAHACTECGGRRGTLNSIRQAC